MKKHTTYSFRISTTEELLSLMNIYLTEWIHRDTLLWKQIFSYFFAILIVIILPFADGLGVHFGDALPTYLFPIIGIFLSIFFIIISIGYADRLTAIGKTYSNLIDMLPPRYRRIKLEEFRRIRSSNIPLSYIITIIMFIALFSLSLIVLYIITLS